MEVRAVLHGRFGWGDETRNVFYFQGSDAVAANGQDIADSLRDLLDLVDGYHSNQYRWTGATIYSLNNPGVPGIYHTFTAGDLVGGSATDPLAPQIALLLSLWAYTPSPKRKRLYMAGLHEAQMTNGLWVSTLLTGYQAVINNLLDYGTFSGMALDSIAWKGSPYLANVLEDGRVEQIPATQRRRRRGQGI